MKGTLFLGLWLLAELSIPLAVFWILRRLWRTQRWSWLALVSALFLVLWGNFSFAPYAVGAKNLFPSYHYVSSDGGFEATECTKSTACTWSVVLQDWNRYHQQHPSTELLRREPIRLWKFWHWWDYATDPRWRLLHTASVQRLDGLSKRGDEESQ